MKCKYLYYYIKMIDIRKMMYGILLATTAIISYYLATNIYNNVRNTNNILNIAILNGIKLKEKAECFKLHGVISENLNKVLREINKYEIQIRNEYNNIQNNKKLSSKQKQNKIKELESNWKHQYLQYNKEIQNIRDLDKKLTDYIYKKLNEILENTAKEMNINVIINKENNDAIFVFYNKSGLDITDKIIEKLDGILKNFDTKDLEHINTTVIN